MLWIGTSWKMNGTVAQARAYAAALSSAALPRPPEVQVFVIPPFTALLAFREALGETPVLMGAQTMHQGEAGAYTGEVSPVMLREVGCALVELGHSERRALFNETDEAVNAKVHAALRHGLRPLVCVGETARERSLGAARETVLRQAVMAFADVSPADLPSCLLAYEPVWAIGERGMPATPDDAAGIHKMLKDRFPAVPVLYGGSVAPGNAAGFTSRQEIDGLFVGRAAWTAAGLSAVLDAARQGRRTPHPSL
jgi:triosephosphate isomerase